MAKAKKTSSARTQSAGAARSAPRTAAKKTSPAKKPATTSASAKSPKTTATKPRSKSTSSSADSVDEQLARYRSMRDFKLTAEPTGSAKKSAKATPASSHHARTSTGLPFVIQKHAASHLHYDFRLGWNGVLKSWAVAKGPSYYPGDRRLAVQVEDHPIEYGGFEGIIPKGQYGGGTVMVWDQGTWWPQPGHENVDAGLRDGSLKFEMNGAKMHGKWTLVRMKPRPGSRWGNSSKPNWLLIKEHDDFERGPDDEPITEAEPDSAVTGRSMDQIAHASDHVWNSNKTAEHWNPQATAKSGQAWYRRDDQNSQSSEPGAKFAIQPRRKSSSSQPSSSFTKQLSKLPREPHPKFISPQLADETTTPPDGSAWLHEIKLDGYRIQARKSGERIELLTRKGLDWAHRMRPVANAIASLPVASITLDGEVVVLDDNGISSFAALQASFQNQERHPLTYFVFDLLHIEGHNPRNLPLRDRKALLADLLPRAPDDTLRLSEHIEGSGPTIFHHACELHTEGILSKRADAPFRSGRSSDWLKSKCRLEQEFVIGGYSDSKEAKALGSLSGPDRFGSLLLGVYANRKLIYTGRTGTGFSHKLKRDLYKRLHALETDKMPFATRPGDARRDVHWVEPKLVAQVRFATWTADNLVRQAAFLGLREDKPPSEVTREMPTTKPAAKSASHRASTRNSSPAARSSAPAARNSSPAARSSAPAAHSSAPAAHSSKPKPAPAKSSRASSSPAPLPSSLRLTHPDKILDPETSLTKRQLAEYYIAVASRMLPHISNRPLSLVRCPEGAGKPCFFQKHVTSMLPPGIGSVQVVDKKSGKPEPYITLTGDQATPEALASLAQLGVLEVHPWGSCNKDLERPDRLIFDLDPDESLPWSTLCEAAAEIRKRLKRAGLECFLKTTGGKGLHVVAPIQPTLDWPTLKETAHNLVLSMERSNPALYLTKMTKSARKNKIYLDYLRNERGATAVAPFSPRARLGAPVSLPLPWSALKLPRSLPARPIFRVAEFDSWRERLRDDPWKSFFTLRQRLDPKAFASG
jgi:bifunctional non-homologous end joining protein LigD